MQTSLFEYELPESCIAQYPTETRDGARMMVVERHGTTDDWVREFCHRVPAGALLVLNDTRVRRARIVGTRSITGGNVELLLLDRCAGEVVPASCERWVALGRPLRRLRPGVCIDAPGLCIRVLSRTAEDSIEVEVSSTENVDVEVALERHGHVPIPPYLGRADVEEDGVRYQTVYAQKQGSVAAPTAGLHLTEQALKVLRERGVEVGTTTLHVGVGTFRPVSVDDLDEHPMHAEWFEVRPQLSAQVLAARKRGAPVIAVGTTAVRALESAADPRQPGMVRCLSGETTLLIQPGYAFRVVDGFLTNFHQPRSTLMALVGAAIGVERLQQAYRAALVTGYRFLSYGDAMWIPEVIR